jgi:hypothetical protein
MTSIAKIIELGGSMAKAWRSDDEAIHDWYERTIRPLDDSELPLVHFACKMLLAERPYVINTTHAIDPRFYEIAEKLGAHAMPWIDNPWADDRPGLVSVRFVPPGLDVPPQQKNLLN